MIIALCPIINLLLRCSQLKYIFDLVKLKQHKGTIA